MKDILLKIVGMQITERGSEEQMEFITEGRFARKGDAMYLIFEESELSGVEGCTTSLKISGEKVRMKRYGEEGAIQTAIEFEKGRKFTGWYETPFGTVAIEVLTNGIENKLDPDGAGTLGIDCSVSLKGLIESRNLLRFEIM